MRDRLKSISPLFAGLVFLPTLLAALYFGVFAEDVYVSESHFIVRSPERPDSSPLGNIIGSGALSSTSEESQAVREFVHSRDALEEINEDDFVRESYGDEGLFFLDRFGGLSGDSFEQLYQFYGKRISVEEGDSPMILRLRVEAFSPEAAHKINERLLQRSEALVNALSDRARRDAIRFSVEQVAEAREQARVASLAVASFRDREGVIDPELQASVNLEMVAQLQERLVSARTRLQQMRSITPQASQIPFLETQVHELEQEIARQTARVAGGQRSLSANAARYQELQLASQFAEQQLAVALASLQEAEIDARRQQAYVDRISEPSLPDYAGYPRRLRGVLATLVLGLLAWGVVAMLLTGVREHRD